MPRHENGLGHDEAKCEPDRDERSNQVGQIEVWIPVIEGNVDLMMEIKPKRSGSAHTSIVGTKGHAKNQEDRAEKI